MGKIRSDYPYIIFLSGALIGLSCFFFLYPRFGWETFSWSGADASEYNLLADNLVRGYGFSLRTSPPYIPSPARMPGYPAIIALSKLMFDSVVPVIVLQILAYALSGVLTYRIARMFMGERMSTVAGFLVVFHITILFMALSLMTESFFIAALLASVYFLLRYFEVHEARYAVVSILLLGGAALLRPTPLYMIFLWIGAIFWDGFARRENMRSIGWQIGLVILIFVLMMAPWMVRNKVEFGRWGLISANSFGFYAATPVYLRALREGIPHQEAKARLLKEFEDTHAAELARDTNYADFAYKGYDKFEYGDWFAARSNAIVKENFGLFIKEVLVSVPDFLTKNLWLHPFEKYDILHPDYQPLTPIRRVWVEEGISGVAREIAFRFSCGPSCILSFGIVALGRIFYIILAVFSFLGLYFMIRSGHPMARRAGILFLFIILYFAAVHLILTSMAGHERYRLPIVPLMVVTALVGAEALWRRMFGGKEIRGQDHPLKYN